MTEEVRGQLLKDLRYSFRQKKEVGELVADSLAKAAWDEGVDHTTAAFLFDLSEIMRVSATSDKSSDTPKQQSGKYKQLNIMDETGKVGMITTEEVKVCP